MKKFVLNGVTLDTVVYPNGEVDVKNNKEQFVQIRDDINTLEWYNCSLNDLPCLQKIVWLCSGINHLYVDYLPYQRSDRDFFNQNISPLVTKSITYIKDTVGPDCVIEANDLHCKLHNKKNFMVSDVPSCVKKLSYCLDDRFDTIIFPDMNAYDKYIKFFYNTHIVALNKSRDALNGTLLKSNIHLVTTSNRDLGHVCIIDDICDRGGTFLLAKKVLEDNDYVVSSWTLSVSHNTNCEKDPELLKQFNFL